MTRLFIFLVLVLLGVACTKKNLNKYSDSVLVRIAEFQDRRQTDSLLQFFNSENHIYRKEAALAFASVQDTLASVALGTLLLEDKSTEVRQAAAFSLGQTGGFLAVNSLIPAATDKDSYVVREVLEALGKTVSKKDVDILITYKAIDSLTQTGLTWGFYQLGLRGLADSIIVEKCKRYLRQEYSLQTRLGAAHFFNRSPMLPVKNYSAELIQSATTDENVYVRMAATSGLRKIKSTESVQALKKIISTEKDYRVRCNAVRALSSFPFDETQDVLMQALDDVNVNVKIAASELFKAKATAPYRGKIIERARLHANWRVQADLYSAALKLNSTKELIQEIELIYSASTNNYQKSWLLESLSVSVEAYPFISKELMTSNVYVIKSSAAQALTAINHLKEFSDTMKEDFLSIYKQALSTGDPGVIVSIATALGDSILNYRAVNKDFNFLYETKKKLTLPKDIEAMKPLEEAIAYFEGKEKPSFPKNEFNHPINWEKIKAIKSDEKVIIKTTKGDITLRLFVDEAPGSVANFVELCNQNYFDGKYFHRVVPNFVAQAGCHRGDGYGSEAYSIRSEFSQRRYTEGSVGMASAGKDTEGTQWFITHSPTPHLDGKYTVFAEVVSGMDVVHQMEVGDKIIRASLMK